jgi:dipeptidyl aminopeptidase/acylaminoacyl peptidase
MTHRNRVSRISAAAILAAALLAAAAPHLATQEKPKRAMSFMDVLHLRSTGGGRISPDGKWVVYTISSLEWKAGRRFTDIWVAPADGSAPPRQLTFTKEKSESSPAWARDSRTIGFLSDREGNTQQLYLLRTDGGEARKVTDAKDGVNSFAFSREGKWAAFSAGKPEERQLWLLDLAKDDAPVQLTKHPAPVRTWEWSPDSTRIFFLSPDRVDKDDQRRRERKFDVRIIDPAEPPAHLWSVTIADKATRRHTSGNDFTVLSFAVSQDSAQVAFRGGSTDRHANSVTREDSEVYLLALASGEIKRLTSNNVGESQPRFSPDSKWLVFTAPDEFTWGRNSKFYVAPVAGGVPRKLLADFDYNVGAPSWSADSKTLYFNTGIGVDDHFFAADVAAGKLTQLTRERGDIGGSFDDETGLFLLSYSNPAQPGDYYVARPETIGQRARWARVSNANPQAAEFQLAEYETVRWKSTDGREVEGILAKPVGYEAGKRYPLIVQLHGGPAAASGNSFSGSHGTYVHVFAAGGYAVFQPNYRGSDNYGEKFRMQIAGDYFRQAYDDIITGVDHLIARGIADPAKLGMMGWSAGGHWSNWTLTQTDRFKAISSGAGAVNWISMYAQTDVQAPREFYFQGRPYDNWDHFVEVSPLRYIKNAKTPTLIHVCQGDPRVPKPQSDELHMALKKLGVPTEYIVYPQNSHGITDPRYQLVKMVSEYNWFEKWIKGKDGWFEWKELLATLEEPREERRAEPPPTTARTELLRNQRQEEARGVLGAVVDADGGLAHLGGDGFERAGVQVARKMRQERRGNLHADAVALPEQVAGEDIRQPQLVHVAGLQQFALRAAVAVAGANHLQARRHQVERRAVRRHVHQAHPQVGIRRVGRKKDFRRHRTGDFRVLFHRRRVENQYVFALCQIAIVVRAGIERMRVHDGIRRVADKHTHAIRARRSVPFQLSRALLSASQVERRELRLRQRPGVGLAPAVRAHHEQAHGLSAAGSVLDSAQVAVHPPEH